MPFEQHQKQQQLTSFFKRATVMHIKMKIYENAKSEITDYENETIPPS